MIQSSSMIDTIPTPPISITSDMENGVNIYTSYGKIIIEKANAEISIFDINGRLIAKRQATSSLIEIKMSMAGTYIVRVGSQSKKVVLY